MALVQEAQNSKAPGQRFADRAAFWLVLVALIGGTGTFLVWWAAGAGVQTALLFAITVVVITCPDALGLATPTAIMVGTGLGAQRGVLFKNATALESSARIETVVMDKTGTLTKGEPEVTDVVVDGIGTDELLSLVAAVERESEHPLAGAIVRYATERGAPEFPLTNFRNVPGHGAAAEVDGRRVAVGNRKLMIAENVDFGTLMGTRDDLAASGRTAVLVAVDGQGVGVIALADAVRETSAAAVAALHDLGVEVVMLSGDNEATAQRIAGQLGIDTVIAEVLPGDKAAKIVELQNAGKKVAMVGGRSQRCSRARTSGPRYRHRRRYRRRNRNSGPRADAVGPTRRTGRSTNRARHPPQDETEPRMGSRVQRHRPPHRRWSLRTLPRTCTSPRDRGAVDVRVQLHRRSQCTTAEAATPPFSPRSTPAFTQHYEVHLTERLMTRQPISQRKGFPDMKKVLAISAAATAALFVLTACNSSNTDETTSTPTSMSAESSSSANASTHNQADVTFAEQMIPHHSQAVQMSDMLLSKDGIDPRVTTLAEQIKAAQAPEIEQLQAWLTSWGQSSSSSGMNMPTTSHSMEGMTPSTSMNMPMPSESMGMTPGMMEGMMSADDMTALQNAQGTDAAKLFLAQMIDHHRGAVAMAQTEVDSGQYPEAISMAQTIISAQNQEITTMEGILATL